MAGARGAVPHFRCPLGMGYQLETGRPLRAEMAAGDRRPGVALDADQSSVAMVNKLTASDAAVRTDRAGDLGIIVLRTQLARGCARRIGAGGAAAILELANERPFQEQFGKHDAESIL